MSTLIVGLGGIFVLYGTAGFFLDKKNKDWREKVFQVLAGLCLMRVGYLVSFYEMYN